jgi:UDP-N-acetylglucosamine diphosphorylase/glucosamine-1-phosphate N-acetyltransferase
MRILLFEDHCSDQMEPVALLRPVFELVCGRESLRRRLQRWYPSAEFGAWVRPWLADAYQEMQPDIRVNDAEWIRSGPLLLVNGQWLPERRLTPLDLLNHQAGFLEGHPMWMMSNGDELTDVLTADLLPLLTSRASRLRVVPASGEVVRYPWDLIGHNSKQLIRDFQDEGVSLNPTFEHVQVLGEASDVYVSSQASIDPYVVIDARKGPVSIDREAVIQSFTRIEGPCHIGRGSQVFRALIRGGTTIGEQCRVGGEIEESILHGFVNKYHEGFLGHSYVCPWVNLGAMSSTSDLKNDYSTVQVRLQGQLVDSGLSKVGSFIGDHTKTALDSMFNTGSSVGVMTMVVPGGRLLPRHVPSFSTVMWGDITTEVSLEESIATARTVMIRRGHQLSEKAERLLRTVYTRTDGERKIALQRFAQRRDANAARS